jgi:hypothetical protein
MTAMVAGEATGSKPGLDSRHIDHEVFSPNPQTKDGDLMASDQNVRVAIVGLGFGAEFIPIYQNHPNAEMYAICRRNKKGLDECGDRYGIAVRYTEFEEVLKDPKVDAVHINSPIPDHEGQSVAALKASARYRSWSSPLGKKVEAGQASFEELEAAALRMGDVTSNQSGRQEMLENLINEFI